jgi:hypothetical protein
MYFDKIVHYKKFFYDLACSFELLTLSLNEWRFNLSFPLVSMLFLNSWTVSIHIVRYRTNPPVIQTQHWHSKEAQIEPAQDWVWAFRIQALVLQKADTFMSIIVI